MKRILKQEWAVFKEVINKPGIYQILNTITNKIYVGSACCMRERWNIHLHRLRKNEHHSKHLQNAFNKYGEDVFEFSILEVVDDKNNLTVREQYYLDSIRPYERQIGYNNRALAHSMLGYKHTEETRRKNSEAQKLEQKLNPRRGAKAPWFGKFGALHHGSTPIDQFDLSGNFLKTWDCINSIGRDFKKQVRPNIIKCCNGQYKQAYGFIWRRHVSK